MKYWNRHSNKARKSGLCSVWDWLRRAWKIRRGSRPCYEFWFCNRRLLRTFHHNLWSAFSFSIFCCLQLRTHFPTPLRGLFVYRWMFWFAEKAENKKKMRYLMGESMGGAVALLLHRKKPQYWDGAILVAPMCKVPFLSPIIFVLILSNLTHVLHTLHTLLFIAIYLFISWIYFFYTKSITSNFFYWYKKVNIIIQSQVYNNFIEFWQVTG